MSDLQNQTPADTYKGLLQVGDYTDGVTNNTGANALQVTDGAGVNTALALSTNRVGIGNASPQAELDVSGGIKSTTLTTSGAVTGGSVSTSGAVTAGSIDVSGNVVADEYALDQTSTSSSAVAIHAPATNELAIRTNSTERVRINSDGDCGIGVSSPNDRVHIKGDASDNDGDVCLRIHNPNGGDDTTSSIRFNNTTNTFDHGAIVVTREGSFPNLGSMKFYTNQDYQSSVPAMVIDSISNVGIGTTEFGTNASGVLGLKNAFVIPTSSPADMVQLYAEDVTEDVTTSSELRVRDEAGNVTTLSPHAKDAPSSLYDRPPGAEEMHRSANHYLGTITFTNVDRRNVLMQKQLNGEELPEDRTFTVTETFAEYNARTGADLQVEDWDANQQAIFDAQEEKVVARQAEIDAWDNEEEEAPEPLESYVKKPKPDWLP